MEEERGPDQVFKPGMACPVCGGPGYAKFRGLRGHWTAAHERHLIGYQCPLCPYKAQTVHGAQNHVRKTHGTVERKRFVEEKVANPEFVSPGVTSMPRPPAVNPGFPALAESEVKVRPAEEMGAWKAKWAEERKRRQEADEALRIHQKQVLHERRQVK